MNYRFIFGSQNKFYLYLYDCIGNIISEYDSTMNDNNYVLNIEKYFNVGKYYVQIVPVDENTEFSVNIKFYPEDNDFLYEVIYSSNDILNLFHYDYSSNKKHTTLKYYNNSGAGFYEFKVTGSIVDNVPLEFPEGCIKIYADSSKTILLDEIPFEGCKAVSSSNRLFVYLPKNGYYYIEVELNNFDYRYLRFWIEQDEGYHLDLSNNLMSQPFVPLFENCDQDSYFKKVTLSHRCTLILDALTNDIVSTDIPVIIFQQKYDKVLGNYYFGFIDNVNNVRITYAIERKINENVDINNTLVADPYESGCDVGSEVMFNNGSIREYTITEGFTRNLYLLFDGVPTQYSSRLDYDWYSSNNSVATVTAYGTVLGLNVEEDTEVTIYAIRKSDPSIIYKRTFTILNDFNEEIIEIECDMSYSYSLKNGVYQLQLNSDNSPYPMIQYYFFEVHEWVQEGEFEVTLDYWGRVTATGPGACVIIGTYSLNPRVKIIINLVINE